MVLGFCIQMRVTIIVYNCCSYCYSGCFFVVLLSWQVDLVNWPSGFKKQGRLGGSIRGRSGSLQRCW